jgi:hypothetical protein
MFWARIALITAFGHDFKRRFSIKPVEKKEMSDSLLFQKSIVNIFEAAITRRPNIR